MKFQELFQILKTKLSGTVDGDLAFMTHVPLCSDASKHWTAFQHTLGTIKGFSEFFGEPFFNIIREKAKKYEGSKKMPGDVHQIIPVEIVKDLLDKLDEPCKGKNMLSSSSTCAACT